MNKVKAINNWKLKSKFESFYDIHVSFVSKFGHHTFELVIVDLAIPVCVDFSNYFFPNTLVALQARTKDWCNLHCVYWTSIIFVKKPKRD